MPPLFAFNTVEVEADRATKDIALTLPITSFAFLLAPDSVWFSDWLWGVSLVVFNVMFHVGGLLIAGEHLDRIQRNGGDRYQVKYGPFFLLIGGTTLYITLLHAVEATVWGLAYVFVGASPNFRSAMLYSLGAITSYGHEPTLLVERWRLMGALEALNGVMLFGLTTAFLFFILQSSYQTRRGRAS